MIDFYRKSVLSQLGKDAGNQSMAEYIRNINDKYDKYLLQMKEQKKSLQQKKIMKILDCIYDII